MERGFANSQLTIRNSLPVNRIWDIRKYQLDNIEHLCYY
jgi:hypothetical protein